jgi:Uma2 family endonuclease
MTTDPQDPRGGGSMSVQEYLQLEQGRSGRQYEYLNGVARLMAKGSVEHDRVVRNMYTALSQRLSSGPCTVFRSDVQTFVLDQAASQENYVRSDVTISCDAADRQLGTWLVRTPRVIVEVLAPATEHIDRGRKLASYKACQSIQEIVLIDQAMLEVEVHRRVENRTSWRYIVYGANEVINLASIDMNIPMSELFTGDTQVSWEEYAVSLGEYHHLHERYNVGFEYTNGNISLRNGTPVLLLGGVATGGKRPETALALISDVTKEEAKQLAAFIALLRRDAKAR